MIGNLIEYFKKEIDLFPSQTFRWSRVINGRCFRFRHHLLLDRTSPLYEPYSHSLSFVASNILLIYCKLLHVVNKSTKDFLFMVNTGISRNVKYPVSMDVRTCNMLRNIYCFYTTTINQHQWQGHNLINFKLNNIET